MTTVGRRPTPRTATAQSTIEAFPRRSPTLYPRLQGVDFRRTATDFEVPAFFVQGAHESPGRAQLVEQRYPLIDAPDKDLTVLDTSGHRPLVEQPEEFVANLTDVVLPRTTDDPS